MLEYYYANNTFLLSLFSPLQSTPKLLKHLGRLQHLQVEVGDLEFPPTSEVFCLTEHAKQRFYCFLTALFQSNRGQRDRFLKTLVAIDRCGTSIVSK